MRFLADLVSAVRNEEEQIREGGGPKAIEGQHGKGRLTARERIQRLVEAGLIEEDFHLKLCGKKRSIIHEEISGQ